MNDKLEVWVAVAVAVALSACAVRTSSPPPDNSGSVTYVQQQPPPGQTGTVAVTDPGADPALPMPQGGQDDGSGPGTVTVQATQATTPPQTQQVQTGGGTPPVHCTGQDDIVLSGVTIDNAAGPAVRTEGNCDFTCTGCTLRGRPNAIEAQGNSNVVLTGGTVTGDVSAQGNADVVTNSTQIQGRTRSQGHATIVRN